MSLSRFALPLRQQKPISLFVLSSRTSAHQASVAAEPVVTTDEKPGLLQKIVLRFQGIPLKGEVKPKSMLDDMGLFHVPPPLPSVPKDFKEYPERDLVNYPYPARPAYEPKTRMLLMPDSWCTPFHKITGTSGPYLFYGGFFAFLVNKEFWVFEEQGHLLTGFIAVYFIFTRLWGYKTDKYAQSLYDADINKYKNLIEEDLKDAKEFRKNSALETGSFQVVKADFPTIFKENLGLQLEATYRKNISAVSSELKRRLDYLREVEETKQRFERDVFIREIVNGAQRAIESNEGNIKAKYLDSCIAQIKSLKV